MTIGPTKTDVNELITHLDGQTFYDFELVFSTAPSIPKAWNKAISKADGDLLVFTETDCEPLTDDWLETVYTETDLAERKAVHFGQIGRGLAFNFANLAVPASVMDEFRLNESYPVAEDTELFARMDRAGVEFEQKISAPVYHEPQPRARKLRRSFTYGMLQMRCLLKHGCIGPSAGTESETNVEPERGGRFGLVLDKVRIVAEDIASSGLFYAGSLCQILLYLYRNAL